MKPTLCLILVFAASLFAAKDQQTRPRSGDIDWERITAEAALHRYWKQKLGLDQESSAQSVKRATADQGNIAVVEDDGTILTPANPFDLDSKSLRLTLGSDGAYRITAGTTPFDTASAEGGTAIPLQDDDSVEIQMGFVFPFYSQSYASVFLNSDGNLTFTRGDVSTNDRDLVRLLTGPPRIAPFLKDLNPFEGGRMSVVKQADRVIFSWLAVPLCCKGDSSLPNPVPIQTFQAVLFSNGNMDFVYGFTQGANFCSAGGGCGMVVGLSPGPQAPGFTVTDLSTQTGAQAFAGPVAEAFSVTETESDIAAAFRFYSTHEDAYDYVLIWLDFPYILRGGAFAYELNVSNDVTGIGLNTRDASREFGSAGHLKSFLNMGKLSQYPSDPTSVILGANSTLSILGQESGHRWLAFLRYPTDENPRSTILLGRDNQHWSFFFDSEASVMEGNAIRDNEDGTFFTTDSVSRYGALDQYVMGLRAPEEVTPSFVVTNPSDPRGHVPSSAPQIGQTFGGTKLPVTIDKVIQANGPRLPPAAMAPKDANFAFVLVTRKGVAPSANSVAKLENIRAQWEQFWNTATSNRSQAYAALFKSAKITPLPAAVGDSSKNPATLRLASPAPPGGVTFQLQSSDSTVLTVPPSVTVPAGATTASLTMTAQVPGIATVKATAAGYEPIAGAVSVNRGAVVNSATFERGSPVSPGAIVSIFAPNLSAGTQLAPNVPLPTLLGGTSVSVGSVQAPLFFVSSGQVNFQVPFDTRGSYAPLMVSNAGSTVLSIPLLLTAASPGLFTRSQDGNGLAVLIDSLSGSAISASSPAKAGQFISIFVTGLGTINPPVVSGRAAPSSPLSNTVETPQVTIGGLPAKVLFSGLAPTFVGLYQLNVQVPAGVSGAALPLVVTISGASSNITTIPVQ